jgi:hypothetical protein
MPIGGPQVPGDSEEPRMRCRACGEEVLVGRFCASCGLTLPLLGRSEERCTTCSAQVARGARYCTDCGGPVTLS